MPDQVWLYDATPAGVAGWVNVPQSLRPAGGEVSVQGDIFPALNGFDPD